jgi:predicted alpha/beta superfamily hydrolase
MKTAILFLLLTLTQAWAQQQDGAATVATKPFVLGVIDQLQSKELGENRIVNIYLPEGYNRNDTITYPVIYLLDGSADEDFIHVAGLIQFNNFSWVDRVPKSIVVGIANVDRKRDFTYPTTIAADKKLIPAAGKSAKFISFIEKELQPYILKKYKGKAGGMLIGQSLGGLLATEILLKKPLLFDKYVIISPSIWWDNGSLLKLDGEILKESFKASTHVYIGVGKEGLTPDSFPRVMETDANLLAEKIRASKSKEIQVHFDYLPAEDHATITHQAVFNALRLLYPAK